MATPTRDMAALSLKRPGSWLGTVLLIHLFLCVVITCVPAGRGEPFRNGLETTALGQVVQLRQPGGDDSWEPMLRAYRRTVENPGSGMYDVFFHDRVKFQYPPSSLLLFDVFPRSLTRPVEGDVGAPMLRILSWLMRAAVLATLIASAAILEICLKRSLLRLPAGFGGVAGRVVLSLALGLTYYPLLKGYQLGQIQVFLNAFIAFAILLKLAGREVSSGALFGACCLVKPQYGILLAWSLSRRKWRFLSGFAAVFLAGLAVSLFRFGLDDHLAYLKVLTEISHHGETFWANQSVNGLLNRWLENGSPTQWSSTAFAPFHPAVYAATVVSSLAILALALLPRVGTLRAETESIDLSIALAAATIASPIAWEHHYGTFLPIFGVAMPWLLHLRPLGRATAPLLAASFVAMAGVAPWPDLLFRNPWTGLAGSHLFFGGLVLFGLLLALRVESSRRVPLCP